MSGIFGRMFRCCVSGSAMSPASSFPSGALVAGLLAVAALVGAIVGQRVVRGWRAMRLRARMRRARVREAFAAPLLARGGYTVLASQVTAPCPILHDGELRTPDVRADYLVARRGRTYVAEAKSGPRATDPTERATRRQLLEYAVVYDVDGVLLVDTEAGTVSTVEFPGLRRPPPWRAVALGAAVGLAAGIAGTLVALGAR